MKSVKKWQEEKGDTEAKITGMENFQKLVVEQPNEVVLKLITD